MQTSIAARSRMTIVFNFIKPYSQALCHVRLVVCKMFVFSVLNCIDMKRLFLKSNKPFHFGRVYCHYDRVSYCFNDIFILVKSYSLHAP